MTIESELKLLFIQEWIKYGKVKVSFNTHTSGTEGLTGMPEGVFEVSVFEPQSFSTFGFEGEVLMKRTNEIQKVKVPWEAMYHVYSEDRQLAFTDLRAIPQPAVDTPKGLN